MTALKKQLSMWNKHQMYFWWVSAIPLTPINIYITDLGVNMESLQQKFVNDRRTGRVVSADGHRVFTQSHLNQLTNYFSISGGRLKFLSILLTFLPVAGGWNETMFKVPVNPNHSVLSSPNISIISEILLFPARSCACFSRGTERSACQAGDDKVCQAKDPRKQELCPWAGWFCAPEVYWKFHSPAIQCSHICCDEPRAAPEERSGQSQADPGPFPGSFPAGAGANEAEEAGGGWWEQHSHNTPAASPQPRASAAAARLISEQRGEEEQMRSLFCWWGISEVRGQHQRRLKCLKIPEVQKGALDYFQKYKQLAPHFHVSEFNSVLLF